MEKGSGGTGWGTVQNEEINDINCVIGKITQNLKMIRKSLLLALFTGIIISLTSFRVSPLTPEDILAGIPNVDSFKRIEGDDFFSSTYEVWFRQPLDYNDPNSPVFPLKVYYSHKGFDRPVVLVIDGYAIYTSYSYELTQMLDANQITIEHRFYDKSRPKDSIPWSYLKVRQAAYDQHNVIEAFKPWYKEKWVSTGISKSGQTTIFHRRFYPNDVDVSIPYVAPLNFSDEDPRVYDFLAKVGTEECRNNIRQYQLQLFEHKDAILPMVERYTKIMDYDFPMGISRAYDLSVLEYEFSFWQWGANPDSIPPPGSPVKKLSNHILKMDPFSFFNAKDSNTSLFIYQAMTEIGMYGYDVRPFAKYFPGETTIDFSFAVPGGKKVQYSPEVMKDIDSWVKDSGNYILYIYGEYDAWSSTAAVPGEKTNAVKMVNPKGSHGTRIQSFPEPMQDSIYNVLGNWLGMDLKRLSR